MTPSRRTSRKAILPGLLAFAVTIAAVPTFMSPAQAHRVGPVCSYQQVDRYGNLRNVTRRCHHLPAGFQYRPRAGLTLYFDFNGGWYFGTRPRPGGQQELVCLVTFYKRNQVEAGADKNVQRAVVLPLRIAERRDGPNDRQRIFDYGSNRQTRETCRYLDRLNA